MQKRLTILVFVASTLISGGTQTGGSPAQGLQATLQAVEQAIEQRQYAEALEQLDKLRPQGRRTIQEQAYLVHLRARTLHRLRREESLQECIALWEQTRQTYERLGNAPLAIEATLSLAFCYWQSDRPRAQQLLDQVWQRLRSEQASSLELAQALSFCAADWFDAQEWSLCQQLWARAVAILEALDDTRKDALLAQARYNLGVVALRLNQLDTAEIYLNAARATQEQIAADTPALAATLKALGELMYRRNAPDEAIQLYQRATQLYAQNRDETLAHAQALLGLGQTALHKQRWNDAQVYYTRAHTMAYAVSPESREAAQAALGLGAVALETDDLAAAERWLTQATQSRNLEPGDQIQAAHELGRLALRRGDFQKARAQLERVLTEQRALPDTALNIARTRYNLGVVLLEMGDFVQAREHYLQALNIRQLEIPQSVAVAHTLVGLGWTAFYARDFLQARRYFEQALATYDAVNAEPIDRSRALMGLGFVATELSAFNEAQSHFQEALRSLRASRAQDTVLYAHILIGRGNLALRRGAWDSALSDYNQAQAIATALPNAYLLHAQAQVGLGNLALRQRDLSRAESYYAQAQSLLEPFATQSPFLVQIRLNRAILALEMGDANRSAALLANARAAAERLPQSELTARVDLNTAILALRTRELQQMREPLERALQHLQRPGGNPLLLAHALYHRGVLHAQERNDTAAHADFEAALQRYQQLMPDSLYVALAEMNLAKIDYRSGNASRARERLQRALPILERQRSLIFDPESQVAFSEDYFEAYSLLALLEAERGQPGRAAELLEQSRARALTEQVQRTRLELSNAPAALIALLKQQQQLEAQQLELRRQISQLYALVESPPDESMRKLPEDAAREARPLYESLAGLENQLQQLGTELRARFPEVARLLAPPQLNLAVIQQQLASDVALVYHSLVENNLLIVVVTRQGTQAYYGAVDSTRLNRTVELFRAAIMDKNDARVASLGAWLYETLIAPVAPALRGFQRVLLCPEGVLNQLPWAALVVEMRNGTPVYWIERVALHTTPSIGVYRYARLLNPSSEGVLVAAVSEYVSSPEPRVETALVRGRARGNLDFVLKEAESIRGLFPDARMLLDESAQPELIREYARTARIVHFACHARADSAAPLNSMLELGVEEARMVTAAQILTQWQLQADLVMLSACETAEGKVYRYEGVYGLARAFLAAGARSVGATLWQVNDAKTADLIRAFYTAYAVSRMPKDRALQTAQQSMISNKLAPYYWAGFIIVGYCQ